MKTKTPILIIGALVIALVWLAACSQTPVAPTGTPIPPSATPIPSTSTPLPTATPALSPTLAPALSPGIYKMTITAKEIRRLLSAVPEQLLGDWRVQLALKPTDGTTGTAQFSASAPVNIPGWSGNYPGTYSLNTDAHQVTMLHAFCANLGDGLYDWTFDGTTLVFKVVKDPCGDRQYVMTLHPWTKQP